ncbi:signal peptidase II [Marinimicrobium agarilyticum]|uniref:signal peptidase II n=1 Tax=Marinimicrobium agarilyticum TaxID=306546 RepID=UPI000417D7DD|nr:signal peptidase II [Marinimicrobium agarilyticum]
MPVKIPARAWRWYAIALIVIVLDQISKYWVSATLTYGDPVVFTPFFNFTLLHNPGAAFSFLSEAGGWQRWFFTAVAAIVSVVLVVWLARVAEKRYEALALALILGGAIGNLYDRVVLGHVVDFIVVHYKDYYWPAFNIADSAITVGAALLILDMLLGNKDKRHD